MKNLNTNTRKVLKHKRRFCRVQGCQRIVKSQGVCQRHGAKPRSCKIAGCTKQAQGNYGGMCKAHAREVGEGKKPATSKIGPEDSKKERNMKAQLLPEPLSSQNTSVVTLSPPMLPVVRGPPFDKVIAGVPVPKPKADGRASLKSRYARRICKVDGCYRVVKSQGVCQRHGARTVKCKVLGCNKQSQGSHGGMCKAHHQVYGSIHRNSSIPRVLQRSPTCQMAYPSTTAGCSSSYREVTSSDESASSITTADDTNISPRSVYGRIPFSVNPYYLPHQEREDLFGPLCSNTNPAPTQPPIPQEVCGWENSIQPIDVVASNIPVMSKATEMDLEICMEITSLFGLDEDGASPKKKHWFESV